jgi:UDP-glucose 4-epimerase
MSILVTGGAGYIGSHVVRVLENQGKKVVVVDNLSTGLPERVANSELIKLDIASESAAEKIAKTMKDHRVEAVVHLAALKQVGESVEKPELYFRENLGGMANLLEAARIGNVQKFVFSSSAATYGIPDAAIVDEDYECKPINPYGQTKLIGEWMTANATRAWGMRAVNLRYFNVAGAGWPDLADTATLNLVPIVFAALEAGEAPVVFGNDYATKDGSCIRDYVHVLDLAEAHVAALGYLDSDSRKYDTFNVGTGVGASVFDVLQQIALASGKKFDIEIKSRRAGDPPALSADVSRIKSELGWVAKRDLADIIDSAWKAKQG